MNHRLTLAAAVAVILASVSEFSLIHGGAWLVLAAGATAVVALAGTLTRLSPIPAAAGATLLAAAATAPMLVAQSLWLKAGAAVIIITCAASSSGLRALRSFATGVSYLSALLLYLNLLLAGKQSAIRLIPTTGSLRHLIHLASAGASLTKYQPPVNGANHGIQLLAAGSIGLAAIAVDLIAVRLRKPAIAGLPLLVIYMAPIATTANVSGLGSVFAFLVAAAGYLALLSSDGRSRLRGWGRVVTVWHSAGEDERLGGADMGGLTATGRRIGLAAVCVAVVAPLLLPSLNLHRLLTGHSGGGHAVPVGLPDPVDQLHGLLTSSTSRPVLSYQTTSPDAGNYLQVYVLNYDKALGQWDLVQPRHSTAVGTGNLQPAPGLSSATPQIAVRTRITLGQVTAGYSFPIFFLPVPYWPVRVSAPGSWREADSTLMIFSDEANHAGQTYTVTNEEIDPIPAQLAASQKIPAAISKNYLGFSSPVTPQLTKIANKITRGKTTAFAKAVAIERWFHSGRFLYNLHTTGIPNTPQGLLTFLTTSRVGFCQQFAFAMAVLSRLAGIPARVAIGYTAGTRQADGSWTVTTSDAHAWPELYFSGAGWVRFEPTPGGPAGQDTAVQPPWVTTASSGTQPGGQHPGQGKGPSTGPSAKTSGLPIPQKKFQPQQGDGVGTVSAGSSGGLPIGQTAAVLIVLLIAAPVTARTFTRRRRWRVAGDDVSMASAAWQEFCADLEDLGLACRPSESPRTVTTRICATMTLDDHAKAAVGRIGTVVERARYAPAPAAAGAIRSDVGEARRALARASTRTTRWKARLLPASTLRPVRDWARHALGLLTGWVPATADSAATPAT